MTKASKVLSASSPAAEYLLRKTKKKSLPCQQKEREAYEPNLTTTPVGRAWPRSSCVLVCLAWWDQEEAASALKYQACPFRSMAYRDTDGK